MGGGHKDLKLGLSISDLVRALDIRVLDTTEPR